MADESGDLDTNSESIRPQGNHEYTKCGNDARVPRFRDHAILAWPLLPGTSPNLAGSGFILILLAWLVVGSRLRHRGAADFLASLGPRPGETPRGPLAPQSR